jgi:beta-glucosidase
VVTENGLGTQSEQKRIRYLREHIAQMRRAMADGVDVRGYFPWTLVDNYEWKEGWHGQFGLFSFDRRTKARNLEPTGRWFSAYIKAHPNP